MQTVTAVARVRDSCRSFNVSHFLCSFDLVRVFFFLPSFVHCESRQNITFFNKKQIYSSNKSRPIYGLIFQRGTHTSMYCPMTVSGSFDELHR